MQSETVEEEMEAGRMKEGIDVAVVSKSTVSVPSSESCNSLIRSSSLFHLVQDGLQQKNSYEHSKKLTELVDVTYNPRTKQFIFLDTRGITTWYKDGIGHTVNRSMTFPKYQNKLLRNIIYARKYNVYFCLAKDFSLKVLNKNFEETCNIDSDLSSVMFLVFNPVRDELITGGVKGTKVWEFRQVADEVWREIKPMANYKLFLTKELESVKGSWIKKVELNEQFQHMYCCSDTSVQCYDMDGKLLFQIERAHSAQINGCKYSPQARLLITCSNDHEVKVWTLNGGLITVFRGHSKAVTNVVLHPETSMMVLTSSLDGSIKIWSLDIMELLYSVVVATEGIHWMGLTGEGQLWTATLHDLHIWSINEVVTFYALARCRTTSLHIAQLRNKASRVVAIGEDSSVRLVSMKDQKNLSTVLPPPSVSPLTQVLSVAYNREYSLVYILVNPTEIWVYTMKTDPACRTAVWDVMKIQDRSKTRAQSAQVHPSTPLPIDKKVAPTQRASSAHFKGFRVRSASAAGIPGIEIAVPCNSLLALHSRIHYWEEHGFVCPRKSSLLLLGLEDGRILFMDPVNFGVKICELQACKDAILDMSIDHYHSSLVIRSHLREEDLFQFWSVPELQLQYEVLVTTDVTKYARLDSKLFTGHSDGSVKVHVLQSVVDDIHAGLRHTGLSLTQIPADTNSGPKEHSGPIVGMDACPERGIFVTCSADAAIKVWDCNKSLLTEISLSQSLSTAKFLNTRGDLLIGYLNHLFLIDHTKVLPSRDQSLLQSDETFETESEIYEDPAVKYEGAAANPDPLDLESYLVPYNLDLTQRFLAGEGPVSSSPDSSDTENDDDSESQFSHAATEVYQSPAITPRRLSVVDMLVSSELLNKQAIEENKEVYSLRRKQSMKRYSSHTTKERSGSFEFPLFGHSPGPSPTPTPPSTPSDVSVSEVSSETEEEEEEIEKLEEPEPLFPTTKETVPLLERSPPSKPVETAPVQVKEEPRYGLSAMKIDSKALLSLRKGSSSTTIKKPSSPSQVAVDEGTEKIKSRPSTSKASIKKKEHKINRTRVGQRSSEVGGGVDGSGAGRSEMDPGGSSATVSNKQSESKVGERMTLNQDVSKSPSIGMSTIQVEGPKGKNVNSTSKAGNQKKKVIEKKKKKQPIFVQRGQTGNGVGGRAECDKDKNIQDPMDSEDVHGVQKSEHAETVEGTPPAGVDPREGLGAMAMFKAANKLQISQKYGPEQAKIVVAPQASGVIDEDDDLQNDDEGGSRTIDELLSEEDKISCLEDNDEECIHEVEDVRMEQVEEDKEDKSNEEDERKDSVGRSIITSGRSMSAKEGRVRFDIPSQRAQSAAPRLSGGDMRRQLDPGLDNDALSVLSSIARTNSDDELGDIPESRQSIFDDADFTDTPTPPNISVSIMSKTSTRRTSLPDSRIGSGLSRFELDSPISPLKLPFSPLTTNSPLGERILDDDGRGLLSMERGGSEAGDVDNSSDMAPVNYNRAIPFSAPPEGRRARPNTAERMREEQLRPHTAGTNAHVTFQDEDFGSMTEQEFQRHLDFVSMPSDLSGYLKNDGLQLDKNWTDRMIQRHQFLKMQKDQRAKSAADRRQLLELRQRQRRKALLGHHHCSPDRSREYQNENLTQSDPSVNTKRNIRVKSAPARPRRQHLSLYHDSSSVLDQCKQVRHTEQQPGKCRPHSTLPVTHQTQGYEREHYRIDSSLSMNHPGQTSPWNHHSPHQRSSSPGDQRAASGRVEHRPHSQRSQQDSKHRKYQRSDSQHEQSSSKAELASEKPYRFRFNTSKSARNRDDVPGDVLTRDSSTNHLVVKKKHAAKSIPSKPRRYVLVHQPGSEPEVLVPSTLEEQLLAKRFPNMHRKWQQVAPSPDNDIDGITPPPPQRKNSLNPTFVSPLPTNSGF